MTNSKKNMSKETNELSSQQQLEQTEDTQDAPYEMRPLPEGCENLPATPEEMLLRNYELRENELRKYQQRPVARINSNTPLDFPRHLIPAGKVYMWGRLSTLNEPDYQRTDELQLNHWSAVPAHRHPELASNDLIGRPVPTKNYIVKGGLILCERSATEDERAKKALEAYNQQIFDGLQASEYHGNSQLKRRAQITRGDAPW